MYTKEAYGFVDYQHDACWSESHGPHKGLAGHSGKSMAAAALSSCGGNRVCRDTARTHSLWDPESGQSVFPDLTYLKRTSLTRTAE